MPEIFDIGSFALMNGEGVHDTPVKLVGANPVIFIDGNTFQARVQSYIPNLVTQTGLAAGGTKQLLAGVVGVYWLITMLSIRISVAGKIQLFQGGFNFLELWIPDTNTFQVRLPIDGMISVQDNADFTFKNAQAVPIDISVSFSYGQYKP